MAFEEANDALFSEQSIFSKNQDYKSFLHVMVNLYEPIFQGIDVRGNKKHAHTHWSSIKTAFLSVRNAHDT